MTEPVSLKFEDIDEHIFNQIPLKWLKSHCALPFKEDEDSVFVAFGVEFESEIHAKNPSVNLLQKFEPNAEILDKAQSFLKHKFIKAVAGNSGQIRAILAEFELKNKIATLIKELKFELSSTSGAEQKSAVSKLFELIITQSVEKRASDIHIEPSEKEAMIRLRVDGVLSVFLVLEREIYAALVFYIKLLAHLNVAEQRRAQDGSFVMSAKGEELDFRLSTLPLLYGESVVLRVLERKKDFFSLENLHFEADDLAQLKRRIHQPFGLILLTGPTGSGKSTTLYAALNEIKDISKKIITAEDPIEYRLPLVQQIALNEKAGLDFANALRTILRQDPDIIVIGEVRDEESLDIALKSSLTGHLVFSTLHTNDAISAIMRLNDMGAKPYLIASALSLVIAQRLVRRLCEHCKKKSTRKFDFEGEFYEAVGCERCKNSGYLGREVVSEFLFIDESIANLIRANAKPSDIELEARKSGFKTMLEVGLKKARAGVTSIDELLRVVR